MQLGKPDRVPVFCQLSQGHYALHATASPVDIWFRSEAFADALVELQQRYDFDGILVNMPGRDPGFESQVDRIERGENETRVHWRNGCYTRVPDDDSPHYFQGDGSRPFPTLRDIDPDTLYYVEPWDLTEITYPFTWGFDDTPRPFDDYFPSFHTDTLRAVRSRVGDEISVHGEVCSLEGIVLATGEALCIKLTSEQMASSENS